MNDNLLGFGREKSERDLVLGRLRLKDGGGGDTLPPDMEGRVSRLEAHMEHVREDMAEIKADLKTVITRLAEVPTRADLWAWKWQWTALAFATMAIIIGSIIGGLAWIQPAPPPPATPTPIVVTVPPAK